MFVKRSITPSDRGLAAADLWLPLDELPSAIANDTIRRWNAQAIERSMVAPTPAKPPCLAEQLHPARTSQKVYVRSGSGQTNQEECMKSPKLVALMLLCTALVLAIGSRAYSVNVSAQSKEICDNGKDDDGDGAIDGADSDCKKPPATGCSPGYYKNHPEIWVGICCTDSTDPTCATLLSRLTCKGGDAACGRSSAAAFLDACTQCSE
jgi:hypothetical protein